MHEASGAHTGGMQAADKRRAEKSGAAEHQRVSEGTVGENGGV